MKRTALSVFFALSAAAVFSGCEKPPVAWGHVVPLRQVVGDYNANASRIPRLWARAKLHITFTDDKGFPHSYGSTSPLAGSNGLLILSKTTDPLGPQEFVMIGKEAASEVFRLGSSASEKVYYLWYNFGQRAAAWWGLHEFAGAPGIKDIPIEPNQLLAVLGIMELPSDFSRLPTVALSMSIKDRAYVLTFIDRQPVTGDITLRREMYFDWTKSGPGRCAMVKFFDTTGRRVMTATLKSYKPVDITDNDPSQKAYMPTDIEVAFISDSGKTSKLHMVLSEMTTKEKFQPDVFRLDIRNIPPENVVQVDAECGPGGCSE